MTLDETSIRMSGNFDKSAEGAMLRHALIRALALDTKLPGWIVNMEGMSGRKYRYLINNLIGSISNPRYLEVGSWQGSTACSAAYGNKLKIYCIDNWSQFNGPKDKFLSNMSQACGENVDFTAHEIDFRALNYSAIGKYNVYLFDGPHEEPDQFDGVMAAQQALDDRYILIVDDYNWEKVRNGTQRALRTLGADIECAIEILTVQDNGYPKSNMEKSEWHNGYYFAVCSKRQV